jgi:hypothetical protein
MVGALALRSKMRWINKGNQKVGINLMMVERKYKAQYIADLCVQTRFGWSEAPTSCFWCESPEKPEYSNYFVMFPEGGNIMIANGISCSEGSWNGIEAENGEVIFSRFRHDHRVSEDGRSMVDGGRDYFKFLGNPVQLILDGPDFRFA